MYNNTLLLYNYKIIKGLKKLVGNLFQNKINQIKAIFK